MKKAGITNITYRIMNAIEDYHLLDLQKLYSNVMNRSRTLDDLCIMLKNCISIGICDEQTGEWIGYARIISDQIYRALIYDVMVDDRYQGTGAGRLLMDTIMSHSMLQQIERIELYTIDKAPFYAKWDFVDTSDRMTLMRRTRT